MWKWRKGSIGKFSWEVDGKSNAEFAQATRMTAAFSLSRPDRPSQDLRIVQQDKQNGSMKLPLWPDWCQRWEWLKLCWSTSRQHRISEIWFRYSLFLIVMRCWSWSSITEATPRYLFLSFNLVLNLKFCFGLWDVQPHMYYSLYMIPQ